MWRAYGNEGVYALVFDTETLWGNLRKDTDTYFYSAFHLTDAIYDADDLDTPSDFDDLEAALEKFLEGLAEGAWDAPADDVFIPFFTAVTRFKHRAFKEESEVRLVAAPASEKLMSTLRSKYADEDESGYLEKKTKPIQTR